MTESRDSNVAVVFGTSWWLGPLLLTIMCTTNLLLLLLDPVDGIPRPGAWVTWSLLAVGATAVFLPRAHPLAARWSTLAAACAVASVAAVFWDPPSETSGYAPWYLRCATTLLIVIVLRRRAAVAWVAAAVVTAVVLAWAAVSGEDVERWIGLLTRQMASLVAIQVAAWGLSRAARTIAAYRAEERERARSEELRSASIRERRAELAAVRTLSVPLLARVSRGEDDPALRAEATLAEASLRDVLRGRRMAAEPLTSAVLEARRRGVDVTVLDDFGSGEPVGSDLGVDDLDDVQRAEALAWAAERIRGAPASAATATVRLSRGSRGALVTVVTGDDDIETRAL